MNDYEELTLEAGALRLAARAWGSRDAAPVLALHGWLDNAASFDALAPLLPGIRLIALDLPGHGHAQHRPPGVPYHFVDYVADVVGAVEALRLERFALLGHSLGAGIASFVAAVIPRRVTRLALIEGIGPHSASPSRAPAQLRRSIEQMSALAGKRVPDYDDLAAAARARQAAGDFGYDAALMLARRGTRLRDGRPTWRADPALRVASPCYLSEAQVLAFLREIQAPAILVRATGGLLAEHDLAQRFGAVDALHIHDLPGGHHLHLEHPAAVAAVLAPFLAGN